MLVIYRILLDLILIAQDNQLFLKPWTLRGMHIRAEHPHGKLVSILQGNVFW